MTMALPRQARRRSVDPRKWTATRSAPRPRCFNNTMQLNASLYRYDYTDLQLVEFRPGLLAGRKRRRGDGPGTRGGPAVAVRRHTGTQRSASRSSTPRSRTRPTSSPSARARLRRQACRSAPEVSGSAIVSYKWPMASGQGFFTPSTSPVQGVRRARQLPGRTVRRLGRVQLRLGYRTDDSWYVIALGRDAFDRCTSSVAGRRRLQQPVRLWPLQRTRLAVRARGRRRDLRTAWKRPTDENSAASKIA